MVLIDPKIFMGGMNKEDLKNIKLLHITTEIDLNDEDVAIIDENGCTNIKDFDLFRDSEGNY